MKIEKIKRLIALFVIFVLTAGLLTAGLTAAAETDKISLNKQDVSNNIAFSAANMFPGDKVTKDFTVKVSHKKSISLFYRADIRDGYEKLAEVLQINVYLPEKDLVLYDGLMRDMPNSLEYVLAEGEKEVIYRISAYLDTSVGNDYQNKRLIADFRWWYTEESDDGGGNGGEHTPITPTPDHVKLVAEVILDGEYPRGSDFAFVLKDKGGKVIQTVKNKDGLIEFDTLKFAQTGEYIYYIEASGGKDDNIDYDDTVHKIVIKVDKVSNKYIAEVTYEKDAEPYLLLPRFVHRTDETTKPDKPVPPNTPTPPDKPINPTVPNKPIEPTGPNIPIEPTDPTDPTNPENPVESALPKDEGQPTEEVKTFFPSNPKTGDDTEVMLYMYLLGASLVLIVLLLIPFARRKEKKFETKGI